MISADIKKFNKDLNTHTKLLNEHKIEQEQLKEKKRCLVICSTDLKNESKPLSYKELADMLEIKTDYVEEWTINAIKNDIIDARIDQIEEKIYINSHKLRTLSDKEWKQVQEKVREWRQRFEQIQSYI